MRTFGLVGHPLGHSFSRKYFTEKFAREGIAGCRYENFDIEDIGRLPEILAANATIEGFNVTIPHKQNVIALLDEANDIVRETGACNCVRIRQGRKQGFNTDVIGFERSLREKLRATDRDAFVLGTGGSSKAVTWVLGRLGIAFRLVSRNPAAGSGALPYEAITPAALRQHSLIVNTTPLGMHPNIADAAPIPYEALTADHYLFDLVYNPAETEFLKRGAARGARVKNGADMLAIQAEASWSIWNQE